MPELKPVSGGGHHPSVRYSASAVAYNNELIITHGYFYNHGERHPAWQSSAWAFHLTQHKWRKLHKGEAYGAPSARYSASAVLFEHALWMFGGDDGGHKYSMNNYIFGAWFSEMWRFDLRTYRWRLIEPTEGSPVPPKRALHSAAVVDGKMYVYGGLRLGDIWAYSFSDRRWELLQEEPSAKAAARRSSDLVHPGKRHASSMAAVPTGLYLFGGSRHGARGAKPRAFDDLWHFNISSSKWSFVKPFSARSPSARSHLSLISLTPHTLMLYGGAICVPGCKCHGDTWVYNISTQHWVEVRASTAPIHRYRQNLVFNRIDGGVYLFGGESYKPYMYHNSVDRLTIPEAYYALPPSPPLSPIETPTSYAASWTAAESLAAAAGRSTDYGAVPTLVSSSVGILGTMALCFLLVRRFFAVPEPVRLYRALPGTGH